MCVRETLIRREDWLKDGGLLLDTIMSDEQIVRFNSAFRYEYESQPLQQRLIEQNETEGGKKNVREATRKRCRRELQRRCGSKALWEVISYSGIWD